MLCARSALAALLDPDVIVCILFHHVFFCHICILLAMDEVRGLCPASHVRAVLAVLRVYLANTLFSKF
jgi:hypothetical protein